MSHAVVVVNLGRMADLIEEGVSEEGELPTKGELEGYDGSILADLMEPYNENTEVPRYRDYDTKQEKARKILSITKDWSSGDHTYTATLDVRFRPLPLYGRELFPDPQAVDEKRWRESFSVREAAEIEMSDLYTDEEVAQAYNAYWAQHGSNDERYYVSEPPDAEHTGIYHWSTYNPQSKWDWYVVGGRWDGALRMKRGGWRIVNTKGWDPTYWQNDIGWGSMAAATIFTDKEKETLRLPDEGEWVPAGDNVALARDIDWDAMFENDNLPGHAYLDATEGWVENGKLIWFGMSTDGDKSQDEWRAKFRRWVDALPEDAVIAIVDYHI